MPVPGCTLSRAAAKVAEPYNRSETTEDKKAMRIIATATPPPDLQVLVAAFGTYSAIPPAAWASYDRQVSVWLASVRAAGNPESYQAIPDQSCPGARIDPNASAPTRGDKSMDVSNFVSSSGFIKPADLADGPRREVIADVRPGKYERPDMEFQSGGILSINGTNMRILTNAWGTETDAWAGKEVELYVGKTQFQGQDRDSVLVKTISPPIPSSERPKPKPTVAAPKSSLADDLSDEIPF
jgi:hypothetical protein